MAKVWGKMHPFSFPAAPRRATFAAMPRADTLGLHVGPSASWVTSVSLLKWALPTVITKYKYQLCEILSGQIRKQGTTMCVFKCLKLCLSLSYVYCNPLFSFSHIMHFLLFFPRNKNVISYIFMKRWIDLPAAAKSQGSLLNPDFNASHLALLALKQMTLEISEEELIRRSLAARSPL